MATKFAKLRALPGARQRLLLVALPTLPLLWVALRLFGFTRLHRWLDIPPASGKAPHSFEEAAAIGSLINSATFHLLGPNNCLIRSMYLHRVLRLRGVASELRIGMRLSDNRLDAHAWVEVDGRPVNDAPDIGARYVAFEQPLAPRSGSLK